MKATYLLAVAFLEILRLSYRGGVFQKDGTDGEQISALTCAFKYLETPNLPSDLYQCLTAIVHRAFDAALTWLVLAFYLSSLASISVLCSFLPFFSSVSILLQLLSPLFVF